MFRIAAELAADGKRVVTTTTTKILFPTRQESRHVLLDPCPQSLLAGAAEAVEKHRHLTLARRRLTEHPEKLEGLAPELVDHLWAAGCFDWIVVEADGAAGRPLKAPATHEPLICDSTVILVGIIGIRAAGKPLTDHWVFRPERFSRLVGLNMGDCINEAAMAEVILNSRGIFKGSPDDADKMVFLNLAGDPALLKNARILLRQLVQDGRSSRLKRVVLGNALDTPGVLEYHDV